jgi:3-methyladenine DNA glycosylase AlkD
MDTPSVYLEKIARVLEAHADPERAANQERYMKYNFKYFGMGNPKWRALAKKWFRENGVYYGDELKELVRLAYQWDQREMHYTAVEMTEKVQKKEGPEFIELLEWMIATKSWWDTVDWISKMVGRQFRKYPEQILSYTEKWMASGNIWLQRVAIIFQLGYNEKTDFELMKKYILQLADSKEFFIRKAQGWALRQYARTAPAEVREFVQAHPELSGLTKREAMKHL